MPSKALTRWKDVRLAELDEMEAAHAAVGGSAPGRRYGTLQINHAYTVLLSSAFQSYCRDLHSEAVDFLAAHVTAHVPRQAVAFLFQTQMSQGRKLDTGNPNPGNLGADFGRVFAQDFWPAVLGTPPNAQLAGRKKLLEELNEWRNAIAHQDWTKVGPKLHLTQVRQWRSACNALAKRFDVIVGVELTATTGQAPW